MFAQVADVWKRSLDTFHLDDNLMVCGNQLAYAVNYLCLKHQRGKKRSLSGSKPPACDTS